MMMNWARGLVGVAALATLGWAAQAATPADTLVMARKIDSAISFDPAEVYEISSGEIMNNVYLRLVQRSEEDFSKVVGAAAESWTVSDDGLTYTFKIRPDVKFASGSPVTAEDAEFSLRRVIKLKKTPYFLLSQFGWTTDNVDDMVKAVDDTLVLKLTRPLAPGLVLNVLSAGITGIVEKAVALKHQKDGDLGHEWLSTHSAGAGAYILRQWRPNEVVILEANENFYKGPPEIKRIVIQHVAEPATQQLLLENGDIDIARDLGPDQLDAVAQNPDLKIVKTPKSTIRYIGMNTTKKPLDDPKVQEAIRWLINYEGIAKSLLKGMWQAHETVLTGANALTDMPYSFDPEKARKILSDAGYKNLQFTFDVNSGFPDSEIAQALQAGFAKGGITLKINVANRRQTLTTYRARNHELTFATWAPDYGDPHSTMDFFVSNPDNSPESTVKTAAWRNGWASPEAQALMEKAMLEPDSEKRSAMYAELQRILQHKSPMTVTFQLVENAAMRKNIEGWLSGPAFDTGTYRHITK